MDRQRIHFDIVIWIAKRIWKRTVLNDEANFNRPGCLYSDLSSYGHYKKLSV